MQGSLVFENVSKRFGDMQALDQVSFSIQKGEFFSLLGSSGCGKTTLLRIAAGFETPDSGRVLLDGQDITHLPPNKRPLNTVFQNYALFPHLSLWDNIAFGLRVAGQPDSYIKLEVERMLDMIQMSEHGHKYPDQVSGGQKQRIAIARALVNRPKLLLLDEPLSALDLKLRQRMLIEIENIHDEVGITFLFVTHDQGEAMAVSDRIAVMDRGHVEQVGSPRDLYEHPQSSFVAAFIGDTNFLDGKVEQKVDNHHARVKADDFPLVLCRTEKPPKPGRPVFLSIRPEKIHIQRECPDLADAFNLMEGVVEDIVYKGDHTKYWVRVRDRRIAVLQQHHRIWTNEAPITWADPVWIYWHADDSYVLQRYDAEHEQLTELPSDENWEE